MARPYFLQFRAIPQKYTREPDVGHTSGRNGRARARARVCVCVYVSMEHRFVVDKGKGRTVHADMLIFSREGSKAGIAAEGWLPRN